MRVSIGEHTAVAHLTLHDQVRHVGEVHHIDKVGIHDRLREGHRAVQRQSRSIEFEIFAQGDGVIHFDRQFCLDNKVIHIRIHCSGCGCAVDVNHMEVEFRVFPFRFFRFRFISFTAFVTFSAFTATFVAFIRGRDFTAFITILSGFAVIRFFTDLKGHFIDTAVHSQTTHEAGHLRAYHFFQFQGRTFGQTFFHLGEESVDIVRVQRNILRGDQIRYIQRNGFLSFRVHIVQHHVITADGDMSRISGCINK